MKNSSPIIFAIDTTDLGRAEALLRETAPYIGCFKVGLEFFMAHGSAGVQKLRTSAPNTDLFLDVKLHDIPNTVSGAARALQNLEPRFLTVHAAGGGAMIAAAAEALPNTAMTAVTVLTSLDQISLVDLGIRDNVVDLVNRWAEVAISAGARAIVSSPWEVSSLRTRFSREIALITPGVRPQSLSDQSSNDDQKRVMTPQAARDAGADYLVIGRPISGSKNPAEAAKKILQDISQSST